VLLKNLFLDLTEFFKILFLGTSVILTPNYITIKKTKPFVYDKKLTVINPNANLEIDISKSNIRGLIKINSFKDFINSSESNKIYNYFNKCPIKVYGIYKNKKILFKGPNFSYGKDKIGLRFYLLKKNIDYLDGIVIRTECDIKNIKLIWYNSGM